MIVTTGAPQDFSKALFDIARETNQPFIRAALAAEAFARQGLATDELLKRVRAALILDHLVNDDDSPIS